MVGLLLTTELEGVIENSSSWEGRGEEPLGTLKKELIVIYALKAGHPNVCSSSGLEQ